MTKEEIRKVLGARTPRFFDQMEANEEKLAGGGSECFLPGITIQLDAHPVAAFEETKKRYAQGGRTTFEALPDVGDAAYAYEQDRGKSSHVVGVFARTGPHVVTVSMDVNAGDSVESLRPGVVALTKAIVAKLRE